MACNEGRIARGPVSSALASYKRAWSFLGPFTLIHVAARLVAVAVLLPLVSLVLSAAIATSDQSALTDQDIGWFLLTPAGFGCAVVIFGLIVVMAVFDVAMMTVVLRRSEHSAFPALVAGVRFVLRRFPSVFGFGILLLLRILAMAFPFLLAAGAVALLLLGEYDINYYLTHRPPAFLAAGGAIAVIILALAILLVRKLSDWSLALPLLLIGRMAPRNVFVESARLLEGQRIYVVNRVVAWLAIRVVLLASVSALASFLMGEFRTLLGADLGLITVVAIVLLLLWSLAGAVTDALSNGALASMLDASYRRHSPDETGPDEMAASMPARLLGSRNALIVLAMVAVAIGTGLRYADRLLEKVSTNRTVEIIAHRGAAGVRPENTLASVKKAIEDKADWVEIDVQETADGEVIVAHDSDFMKLGGDPLKVWDATMEDVARIDIGSWFADEYAAERTPTLRDVLMAVRGSAAKLLIELKYYGHDMRLEQRVAEIVDETAMGSDVAVMSLKIPGVMKMNGLRPDWPFGVLAATAIGDLSGFDADFVAVNTGQLSLRLIRKAHAKGQKVYVWTVDDPLTMSRMISMGVDGLITNQPALAREVMNQRNELSTPERLLLWLSDQFRLESFDLVAEDKDA
ncbi:glycerophosphodiester phosphodiesterase [Limibaculum sp. FT325]|uniref:glycerophosphodiester phosphodiesterase n=1 Tax=Thermohalobaculum sediminis TaxID=2939436 RepID=UPI0020BFFAC0|nr:glycerophosphodiester phosphodiesterase [Limibaculum sediminis]MCL5779226.1 glycerophosphodiester phosphodiesterase [Limibaculum sediminis]